MTFPQHGHDREAHAKAMGAVADRVFAATCARLKLDQDFAMGAPLTAIAIAEAKQEAEGSVA